VVQEIDAAAMSVWLQYDHFDGDVSGCANGGTFTNSGVCSTGLGFSTSLESMQLVKFGGLINF
jgi:hypothetical protein